jgi:hypothetical protein
MFGVGFRSRGRRAALVTAAASLLFASLAHAGEKELVSSDGDTGDQFGTSLAVDGTTLVVGAPQDDTSRGAAYVFTRTGDDWTQTQKLTAATRVDYANFGTSVAIDGDTIVVGAPAGSGTNNSAGAAYTFTRTSGVWAQSSSLTASDGVQQDGFGSAVAIDGDTIVVGAPYDDLPGNSINAGDGSVYTFARTGAAARAQTAKLTASDAYSPSEYDFGGGLLGSSVAIDGSTIVAGAPRTYLSYPPSGGPRGAVYTFARSGSDRHETAKLTASPVADYGTLGDSVAIDGDTIVAGDTHGYDENGLNTGNALTFDTTGAALRHQTASLTGGPQNGSVGSSVAISGSTIAVGVRNQGSSSANPSRGAVYTYDRTGAAVRHPNWSVMPSDVGNSDAFGSSVATDDDRIIGGSPSHDVYTGAFHQDQGAVYSMTPDVYVSKFGSGTGTVTSSPAGINCGGDCSEAYHLGDEVTLTATASAGSHFAGFNYGKCVGASPCTLTVKGSGTEYAEFQPGAATTQTLTVGKAGTGSGTVTSNPAGINCGADCSEAYDSGTVVTLSPAPDAGSAFAGWSGGCSGSGSCSVTMSQARSVTATFNATGGGDTTPPETQIDAGPAAGSTVAGAQVSFSFSSTEAASTFECSYDGAPFTACTSPGPGSAGSDTRTLANGSHTFAVRARDASGNVDASPATRTFTVSVQSPPPPDTSPPETSITKAPPKKLKVRKKASVRVEFASSEPGSTFSCRVDGGRTTGCSSPATFKLGQGDHTIAIVATDAAGNADGSPATVEVTVKKKPKKKKDDGGKHRGTAAQTRVGA